MAGGSKAIRGNAVRACALLALVAVLPALAGCVGKASSEPLDPSAHAAAIRAKAERAWQCSASSTTVATATPVEILDGDSIVLRLEDGALQEVRLIGIDAPESDLVTDMYSKASLDAAGRFLRNARRVYLEIGPQSCDDYGNTLAYVWLARPPASPSAADVRTEMLNAKMLLGGYAKRRAVDPNAVHLNTKYSSLFDAYGREAQTATRGLWSPIFQNAAGPSAFLTGESTATAPPVASAFVGNSATYFFHRATCPNAIKMKPSHQVPLDSAEAARNAGYRACGICKP